MGGLGKHISPRDREYFEMHGKWYPDQDLEVSHSRTVTNKKVHKTIILRIEYVENQSSFIPDKTREQLCAGKVIRQLGSLIEKGKISKGKGEVFLGHKTKYNFVIDKK